MRRDARERREMEEREELLRIREQEKRNKRNKKGIRERRPGMASPGFCKFTKILGILYIVVLLGLEALLLVLNILPVLYAGILMVVLTIISLLILPQLLMENFKKKHKIICSIIAGILMVCYVIGIIYVTNTMGFLSKITGGEIPSKAVNVTDEPFNVLISGNDNFGDVEDEARSDVNMLMTVNPKEHKILLTSIPRDYYVTLPSKNAKDKLTHSGIYGVTETIKAIENLLDTQINYYVKVDFDAVIKLIDAVGGITVNSDYDFTTSGRENDGYTFVKGENQMNGEQALAFCRERHAFPDGDFQRIKDQQLVLEATLKKCTSSSVVLRNYTSILGALGGTMKTNMTSDEITALAKMQVNDMSGWKIEKMNLEGNPDSAIGFSMPDTYVSVVMPDENSVNKAKNKIADYMGTNKSDKKNNTEQ